MSIKKFNDWTPLVRFLMSMIVIAFLAGVMYQAFAGDIKDVKFKTSDNKSRTENNRVLIQNMQATLQSIQTKQAVITAKLDSASYRSKDFRRGTSKTLERILNKLDRVQP